MVVRRVGGGIAGLRELCAIDAGEPPKVVIERVVLLHDDDHVLHQIRCGHHTFPMPESVPRPRTFSIESTLILPWKHIQTRRRCGGGGGPRRTRGGPGRGDGARGGPARAPSRAWPPRP